MKKISVSRLIKEMGFGTAMNVVYKRNGGILDLKEFTAKQLIEIFDAAPQNSKLRKEVFKEVKSVPLDFKGWKKVTEKAGDTSPLLLLAYKNMAKNARSFDEWQNLHCISYAPANPFYRDFQKIKKMAAEKMRKLAVGFDQLMSAAFSCHEKEKVKLETIVNKMIESAKNFHEWFYVWHISYRLGGKKRIKIEKLAIKKIEVLAKSFNDWKWLVEQAPRDSRMEKIAIERLKNTTDNFYCWLRVLKKRHDYSKIYTLALERAIETAANFGQAWLVLKKARDYDHFFSLVLKKMKGMSGSFLAWKNMYNKFRGIEIENCARQGMMETAETFLQLKVVESFVTSPQDQKFIVQKMIAVAEGFEQWEYILGMLRRKDIGEKRIILTKMAGSAKSLNDWKTVSHYANRLDFFDIEQLSLEKIGEMVDFQK